MYNHQDSPILPVGSVNLLTGSNAEYGTIFNLWEEGCGTYVLVTEKLWNGKEKYRAVITCDTLESTKQSHPAGRRMTFCHDQTGARMGETWTVVDCFPNTKEGLRAMAAKIGKKSIPFATFK